MASLSWFALFILDKVRSAGMSGGMWHLSYGNYRGDKATVSAAQSHLETKKSAVGSKDRQIHLCQTVLLGTRAEVVSLRKSLTVNKKHRRIDSKV